MTWYKDINTNDIYAAGMGVEQLAASNSFQRLMHELNITRIYSGTQPPTLGPMDATLYGGNHVNVTELREYGELGKYVEYAMVDLFHTLVRDNPEIIKELVLRYIQMSIKKDAMKQIYDEVCPSTPTSSEPLPNLRDLKNSRFSFWWDYDEGEVVLFAEANSKEYDIHRMPFDDDDERVDVENEAEAIIKKLYADELHIGEFIETSATADADDIRKHLVGWWESGDYINFIDSEASLPTSAASVPAYRLSNSGSYILSNSGWIATP